MEQQQQEVQHRPMELLPLPPGFRFHPTDEELITHYLARKVADARFAALAVAEADLNKCEPWDLPSLAKMGEKEWYFFCLKDRKYPTGLRTNRATEAGYWKATGKDKDIFRGNSKALVGSKKTLVFYTGRAPKGEKSGWVMHEYRLHGKLFHGGATAVVPNNKAAAAGSKNEWVLCRVFKKSLVAGLAPPAVAGAGKREMAKMEQDVAAAISHHLPPLMDVSGAGAAVNPAAHVTCFSDALEGHQFCFNQIPAQHPPEAAATPDHHHLGQLLATSSPPFLSVSGGGLANYGGPLLHHHGGGASLVQLLEGTVYGGGGGGLLQLDMSMSPSKQQPATCKQGGGERERLSASQDTGLTSDVNPEISSSSGAQRFDHEHHQLWGGY